MNCLGRQILSPKMKQSFEQIARLKEVENLREGFYWNVFIITDDNGVKKPFRFYRNDSKLVIVMFPLNDKACWFVSKERIGFYDKELQGNLTIPKALFL